MISAVVNPDGTIRDVIMADPEDAAPEGCTLVLVPDEMATNVFIGSHTYDFERKGFIAIPDPLKPTKAVF